MSCSKQTTVNYLINKQLVKPNMELYTQFPTERLSNTIDTLTKRAKSVYGVDMGPLFTLQFRDVEKGNYLTQGSLAIVTKTRLRPNDEAFEAIDRSEAQARFKQNREIDEYRNQQMGKITIENERVRSGNNIIMDDGAIPSPTSLPQINIQC